MKSRMSLKMAHVRSKIMLQGPILEIPCVCSRSHILGPILMKLGQNVCLDEISAMHESWSKCLP